MDYDEGRDILASVGKDNVIKLWNVKDILQENQSVHLQHFQTWFLLSNVQGSVFFLGFDLFTYSYIFMLNV